MKVLLHLVAILIPQLAIVQLLTLLEMQSRVFKGLLRPVLTATAIATAIAAYETLREVDQSFSDLALEQSAHACTSQNQSQHACPVMRTHVLSMAPQYGKRVTQLLAGLVPQHLLHNTCYIWLSTGSLQSQHITPLR